MNSAPGLRTAALLGVLVAIFGSAWGALAARQASDTMFYLCIALHAALSVAATWILSRQGGGRLLPVVVAAAVLLRLWFLFEPPLLSGDVYRYVWDGRIVNAGFNPYLHVPADPALAALRDPNLFSLIDKRDYAVTIYPPVAEALFALVTRLSGTVLAMKAAMLGLEGVAVLAVARLLDRLGRPRALLAAYLLHPAPIWEFADNGHLDAAMMAFTFGAFAWGVAERRPYRAALMLTLGALIKPTAALALPAIWRPFDLRLPLFAIALAALCYVPFLSAGTGIVGFLPNYAHEQGLDTGNGFFLLAVLKRLGLFLPWFNGAYLAVSGLILLALALLAPRNRAEGLVQSLRTAAVLVLTFLLLLTPVYPWYFLIAGPFTPLLGLWTPFAMMSAGFLLYAFNPDQVAFFGRWFVVMALILAAALRDMRHMHRQEFTP